MKSDNLHVQYHPGYDRVFVTGLPDQRGSKSSNTGFAVDRHLEFWIALRYWAMKVHVVPVVLAKIQKWIGWKPRYRTVTRHWEHPEHTMSITVKVRELVGKPTP